MAYAKRDIQVKLKKNRIGFIAVDLEWSLQRHRARRYEGSAPQKKYTRSFDERSWSDTSAVPFVLLLEIHSKI